MSWLLTACSVCKAQLVRPVPLASKCVAVQQVRGCSASANVSRLCLTVTCNVSTSPFHGSLHAHAFYRPVHADEHHGLHACSMPRNAFEAADDSPV